MAIETPRVEVRMLSDGWFYRLRDGRGNGPYATSKAAKIAGERALKGQPHD